MNGAVAVVTGGGSGLGKALVGHLAEAGSVPVVLDLRADRVEATLAELKAVQPGAAGWTCDVGDREQVASTFSEIGDRFGRIDLLVNCAGRSMLRPFLEMDEEDFDWILRPNLFGVVHPIRAAVPWMPQGSRIVNVASISGRVATPGEAFYSAIKSAVVSLTESLEAELGGRGIGVTVVLPGEMTTGLFDEHDSWEQRPDFQRRMEIPPDRVARAIARGIRIGAFEVVSPAYMRLVLLLQRLAPRAFRWGVRRYYTRMLEPIFVARSPGRAAGERE